MSLNEHKVTNAKYETVAEKVKLENVLTEHEAQDLNASDTGNGFMSLPHDLSTQRSAVTGGNLSSRFNPGGRPSGCCLKKSRCIKVTL